MKAHDATNGAPSAIYVWLVPSEEVLEQPGSWRIRKWDTAPFPEANYTLSETPLFQNAKIGAQLEEDGSVTPAMPAELGPLVDALRPVVSEIFDQFGSLSRGQALQRLVDAARSVSVRSAIRPSEKVAELVKSLDENRYGRPLVAAVQLCAALADELEERYG